MTTADPRIGFPSWSGVLLGLAATLGACGPGTDANDRVRTTVTDSAGIEIVRNDSIGLIGDLHVEETLRIGSFDDEGPTLFSDIRAVRVDSGGRIYVGNAGSGSIRVFDDSGTTLTEFGGTGEGPSEIPILLSDVILAGDTIVALDWQMRGKIVLFSRDGEFLSSQAVRQPDGSSVAPTHRGATGWLWTVIAPFVPPDPKPGEPWKRSRDVYSMEFGSSDTGPRVYSIPLTPVHYTGSGEPDWGLFRPVWHPGFDGDGRLYLARPEGYRIDVFEPGGLTRSIRREFAPRRLTDEDVAAVRSAVLAVVDTLPMPEDRRPAERSAITARLDVQERLPRPDFMAPFVNLLVSSDGSFWAQLQTLSPAQAEAGQMYGSRHRFPEEETRWDLFDAAGVFVGSVRLPARFRAEVVTGFEVVGVWADDLDVEYVVRYEIVEALEP